MRLCFDATRFGFGLEEAVELAAAKKVSALEYSFQPFHIAKSSKPFKGAKQEAAYLKNVKNKALNHEVIIDCLKLDYCLDVTDAKSNSYFQAMIEKLAWVASSLGTDKLSFYLAGQKGKGWQKAAESTINAAIEVCTRQAVKLLVSLNTPKSLQGMSLKHWLPIDPFTLQQILATCPGLSLAFSPADCLWQGIDYLKILPILMPAIEQIVAVDVEINRDLLSDSGLFGPLWWRYRLPAKGLIDWAQLVDALKLYDYQGSISIHLDDEFVGDDREYLSIALEQSLNLIRTLLR